MKIAMKNLLCSSIASVCTLAVADSYDVLVPAQGFELAAYSFTNSTVANAIPSVPIGTQLQIWNVDNQEYDFDYYVPSGGAHWTHPDWVLQPAQGFWIYNPSANDIIVTIYGTPLTDDTFTITFSDTSKWYLLGSAYPLDLYGGTFLECMKPERYTINSLNYMAHTNDQVLLFRRDLQTLTDPENPIFRYTDSEGYPQWYAVGTDTSPVISLQYSIDPLFENRVGKGFFLKPLGGTTSWTHLRNGATCP